MQGKVGRVEAQGEVRDKDGNVKTRFVLKADVTPQQHDQLKQVKENSNGSNTPNKRP